MLEIHKSNKSFYETFKSVKKNLRQLLGNECVIEHVGSTSVPNVDGKGIVDILIGFEGEKQIKAAVKVLVKDKYFVGRNNSAHKNRVFMASTKDDTTLGDVHLHLTIKGSKDFYDLINIRDFLRQHPEEAKVYSDLKYRIAKETGYDREAYKKQKSLFIEALLERIG